MKNIFTKDKDEVIVGLTNKDISVSYKKKPDWGVQGTWQRLKDSSIP